MMEQLLQCASVQEALDFLKADDGHTLQEHLELCGIPAPSNQEEERARDMLRRFKAVGLEDSSIDKVWNVTGVIRGVRPGPVTVLAGHLDTVFPRSTRVTPVFKDGVYHAPGINDDTRALAELLTIARAIKKAGLQPVHDILFCANSGEEGLGNLRGIRHLFQSRKDIGAFITIDNGVTGCIIYTATGSLRYKVVFKACGGHSFSDFGLPNPIHALGRAIAKISEIQVPMLPKTTFSVGIVEGGTSVNTIASSASMLVDSRSDSKEELDRLALEIRKAVQEAVKEENVRWEHEQKVSAAIELIGDRPAGSQPPDCPIVQIARQAILAVGETPELRYESSTDANIPISLGIPAIAVGRGGEEGGIHSPQEWFRPVNAWKGPQKDLLMVLAIAGLEGVKEPAVL